MTVSPDNIARIVSRKLRRVSAAVAADDTRRFFVPRGLPVRVDLNVVSALLLSALAGAIERRARRVSRIKSL